MIRAATRYVSHGDRKQVAAALKTVYTAVDETAALTALETVREDWGRQYPGVLSVFDNAWEQFIPFLDFDPDIRRVIYTTNAIESMNRNLRKLVKTSGHFPPRYLLRGPARGPLASGPGMAVPPCRSR
ncbi:transposase [Streptomyces noursei]|uniref:transposase n=1 Tax=Streptomyces noursei TaxID=1971 RepID=UPI0037AE098C